MKIKCDQITKKTVWKQIKNGYSNWLFLLPVIIGLSVFTLYPVIQSFVYSLTDFNGLTVRKIGFMNYADIFDFGKYGYGREVWKSFRATFIYTLISIPVNLVLSFTLALALHKNIPGIKVLRLLFYLPVLIPGIVGGQIWIDILSYPTGLFNQWLGRLGLPVQTFFTSEKTQFSTLLVISQWGVGGSMIVWLAALSNIRPSLYEAADLDGASYLKKLFKITLPMCTPIIFYNLINLAIMCLQVFDSYAYLGRGINDGLYFISVRIYLTAFGDAHQYGLACALAWILFCIIGLLTVVMFKTSKWVYYDEK